MTQSSNSNEPTIKASKPKPSTIPWGGLPALYRIAAQGAKKHDGGGVGWRDLYKYPVVGYVDSLMRHLTPILIHGLGAVDEESGEPHVHHLTWCALRLSHAVEQEEYLYQPEPPASIRWERVDGECPRQPEHSPDPTPPQQTSAYVPPLSGTR